MITVSTLHSTQLAFPRPYCIDFVADIQCTTGQQALEHLLLSMTLASHMTKHVQKLTEQL